MRVRYRLTSLPSIRSLTACLDNFQPTSRGKLVNAFPSPAADLNMFSPAVMHWVFSEDVEALVVSLDVYLLGPSKPDSVSGYQHV